ncbi:MAG: hypothetical protein WAK44_26135 [Trebonia sp.]
MKLTMPGTSTRDGCGSRDSRTTSSVIPTATTLTGRFTRKIHRQPKCVASSPPTIGPAAAAAPLTAPHTPNATPRSRPEYELLISAIVVANIAAAPSPCTPRAAISTPTFGARPHASEDNANTTRPIRYTRRRPSRSATDPTVSTSAASTSAYKSITHCRSWNVVCSSRAMSGSATVTIVTSTSNMNVPAQTATNGHHFFISPPVMFDTHPGRNVTAPVSQRWDVGGSRHSLG